MARSVQPSPCCECGDRYPFTIQREDKYYCQKCWNLQLEELTEKALGRRLTAYDRSLDTHIANLRKKLGVADDGSPLIKTVRGQGYIFVAR